MAEKPTYEEMEQRIIELENEVVKRKQDEEALRESEDYMRTVLESTADGILAVDAQGKVRHSNRLLAEMWHIPPELLDTGKSDQLLNHVLDQLTDPEAFASKVELLYGSSEEDFDVLLFKDGRIFERFSRPLKRNGILYGRVWSFRNVTERKQTEKELAEQEQELRIRNQIANIFLTVPDDEMYGELLQVILEAMESKYGIFGYIDEKGNWVCPSMTRDIWDQCQVPDKKIIFTREQWGGIWARAMVEKKTLYSNKQFNLPEGHISITRALDVPIMHQGEIIGNFLVGNKETDYDENDKQLLENISDYIAPVLDARLQRDRAAEKSAKLESQLRQAQKMEALGTLGGGVAHDFNNLLMGIQGRTSLMMMDKDSSHPEFEHLKGIEDYVKSAADLTKQLLGFARGGKYEVKPTDINELIKGNSSMFGRTKKEIKLHMKYQKDVWTVEADQGQIDQVLMNLYVNAWQAMPGGGDLYVQTENVTLDEDDVKPFEIEPGRYVKISVTDTGVGMNEATRQRIFEPFFTTKEMGRGTGLGLASAYGIIKNHGGFINVYSEKGEGTTFNIYLPASEKEIIEEKKLSKDVLRGSETVLIVDDEDMIIDVGEQLLQKLGYEVLIARSGKEATEIYEKNKDKIDIVILDMIMPDMSGSDTFDRLKEIKSGVKVLLSSGYSINGKATEILDRGCNGFIHKPFSMKDFSQKLREILDKD